MARRAIWVRLNEEQFEPLGKLAQALRVNPCDLIAEIIAFQDG
jgi:hypothetical protein